MVHSVNWQKVSHWLRHQLMEWALNYGCFNIVFPPKMICLSAYTTNRNDACELSHGAMSDDSFALGCFATKFSIIAF